ncbi:MAG: nucleoside deaminase [Methanobacterium sp.]|jgi:tRNA(Arg) A34 adenosine deaminase TadA|uniref:nucleoside deaminase n=1 Tax=Methanobacterium sp. TaxID=2164 RepID=UPI0028039A6C|nr:nucleoside deaminase [uncultured Methanobacterium sp.]
MKDDTYFMGQAIAEAQKSLDESGIPIGAVLVVDGEVVGRGHNRLLQSNSAILHGELDCIENAGRLKGADYKKATLYTTLSPCTMCSGAIMLYNLHRVVIGENTTLIGPEELLRKSGVEVKVLGVPQCRELLERYIEKNPNIWEAELERVGYSTD